jgi:hypothetical protein
MERAQERLIFMQTIRVLEKTGKDGTLHLKIPLGKPEAELRFWSSYNRPTSPQTVERPESETGRPDDRSLSSHRDTG